MKYKKCYITHTYIGDLKKKKRLEVAGHEKTSVYSIVKKKRKYNLVVDEFGKRKFETDPDCSGLTHRDIVSP